ncbi:MAG: YicC family protein [Clostridiales bacterium]|nr:YicC family protein [Clostridiales bacterium]
MTGYGRGAAALAGRELTVELKSVNHRFLDLGLKLPRAVAHAEDLFRAKIGEVLARGHVDVFVRYANFRADARTVQVDTALLAAYIAATRDANGALGLEDDLTLTAALRLPDVTSIVLADEDADAVSVLAADALGQALTALIAMRSAEGLRLQADLALRFALLGEILENVRAQAITVVPNYKAKLDARIAELTGDLPVDPVRLATEVALLSDRASVDEEMTRISVHLSHADELLYAQEPVGRKLDFLVQELNREFNTIGSKANDSALTAQVLLAKAEIEKIREQVQNIE